MIDTYVYPFVKATVKIYDSMLAVSVKPGKPVIKKHPYPTCDVSGAIGLTGDVQGTVSLNFSNDLALQTVSGMLGVKIENINVDVSDGIGELINIIAGNAKQGMENCTLATSLPNVIIGENHILSSKSSVPTHIVPFESSIGSFFMEISLKTSDLP